MTNVNPGDLARVVAPYAMQGRGAFVTVEHQAKDVEHLDSGTFINCKAPGVSWLCRGWVRGSAGLLMGPLVCIGDHCLRRVDPGQQDDEILIWAGKPEPVRDPVHTLINEEAGA